MTAAAASPCIHAERTREVACRSRPRRPHDRSAMSAGQQRLPPEDSPSIRFAVGSRSVPCRRVHSRPGRARAPALFGPTRQRAGPVDPGDRGRRRRKTSARSITGTRIGWPAPFMNRVTLDPPPTSYSGVVSYFPSRMRLAFAVGCRPCRTRGGRACRVWAGRPAPPPTTPAAGPDSTAIAGMATPSGASKTPPFEPIR